MAWSLSMALSSRVEVSRRAMLFGGGLAAFAPVLSSCAGKGVEDPAVFPTRPVSILVPFPPGGGTDLASRAVSTIMGRELGQPVVVENRGGANGAIAADLAAAAEPDGYTLFMGNLGTLAITPNVMPNLRYDPLRSFKPITQVSASSTILLVNPDVPAQTFQEFVALCKRGPGQLNYASDVARHHAADGDAEAGRRDRPEASLIPGFGARDHRSAGRACPCDVRGGPAFASAHPFGCIAAAGRRGKPEKSRAANASDDRGKRISGLCGRFMERAACAG